MNRQEIIDQALADLNREDKAQYVDTWLRATEMRINNALRDERMVRHALMPITERIFPLPDNFLEQKPTLTIRSGDDPTSPGPMVAVLQYMPIEQMATGWDTPDPVNPQPPNWFTLRGRNIELGLWGAEGSYMVDMWYYAAIPPMTAPTDNNWLSELAPHIYVEGIKHFGFRQLQEMDNSAQCLVTMTGEINFLNEQNAKLLVPSGPLIQRRAAVGYGANPRHRRR